MIGSRFEIIAILIIISKWIFEKWNVGAWTVSISFRDSDRWRAFVNTVMNLLFPSSAGYLLAS
jgi:hypothetical protein